ncbi:MAG: HmuY family protein [Labilithrix sp.]|nr:HmuY family protein [Labilithrix sp.]
MKVFFSSVVLACLFAAASLGVACSEDVGSGDAKNDAATNTGDAGDDPGAAFNAGEELLVPVPESGRVYAKLASPPAVVTPGEPKTDLGWDLAFEGLDVYTNSGPSGSGASLAFGPLDAIAFLDDVAPQVPFLTADKSGGAFVRWYFYEGAPNHGLYSRFHVFGVKDGDKLYKVQVLSYYGKRDGAAVSALYRIRYAEVGQPAKEAVDLDGTAGGTTAGDPNAPSECIDLGTGARTMLTAAAARTSSAWHLCFRRQDISVNGEEGGPRGVGAIDFDAQKTATEKFEDVLDLTPESELARFDAIDAASFDGQTLRGDRVVSAFSGLWTERGVSPAAPGKFAWLVVGADGKTRYLVGFARFDGATATNPGTIVMRVKPVK